MSWTVNTSGLVIEEEFTLAPLSQHVADPEQGLPWLTYEILIAQEHVTAVISGPAPEELAKRVAGKPPKRAPLGSDTGHGVMSSLKGGLEFVALPRIGDRPCVTHQVKDIKLHVWYQASGVAKERVLGRVNNDRTSSRFLNVLVDAARNRCILPGVTFQAGPISPKTSSEYGNSIKTLRQCDHMLDIRL